MIRALLYLVTEAAGSLVFRIAGTRFPEPTVDQKRQAEHDAAVRTAWIKKQRRDA
jgi:hypothetical protein